MGLDPRGSTRQLMQPDRLNWEQAVAALDGLAGTRVSIRIVLARDPEKLVAVVHGPLGPDTHAKNPSSFWPLEGGSPGEFEQPGVYMSPGDFEYAERRAGGILVIARGDV